MCAQTHGRAYVQPHTPTHPYVYTPMYARIRTYTRTRRKFSDIKSTLQHCQTEFHHQSDSIHFYYPKRCTIRIHIGTTLAAASVQTVSIWHHLPLIYNYPPTIQSSVSHLPFIITTSHHPTYIIFYLYLIYSPTHHPINMSVCYKTLSILYILAAF